VNEGSDMELGARFWLAYIGGAIALVFAGILLFLFIDRALYRWGLLGMFLVFSAILLALGWLVDRRGKRGYDSLGNASQ
jgi:uncharacterized membrane protein YfcA